MTHDLITATVQAIALLGLPLALAGAACIGVWLAERHNRQHENCVEIFDQENWIPTADDCREAYRHSLREPTHEPRRSRA